MVPRVHWKVILFFPLCSMSICSSGWWRCLCYHVIYINTLDMFLLGEAVSWRCHGCFRVKRTNTGCWPWNPMTLSHKGNISWQFFLHYWSQGIYCVCFYQIGSAWSVDLASIANYSLVQNFGPAVTKFCPLICLMTQNFATVGIKLLTAELFLVDH